MSDDPLSGRSGTARAACFAPAAAGFPLRVGVIVDGVEQPAWVRDVIDTIGAASCSTLALLIFDEAAQETSAARRHRSGRHRRGPTAWFRRWLYSLHGSLDKTSSSDAFETGSLLPLVGRCPTLRVGAGSDPAALSRESLDAISRHNLDVIVHLGSRTLDERSAAVATHGIWRFQHDGEVASPTVLWALTPGRNGKRIVQTSVVSARSVSNVRNRSDRYRKSTPLVVRSLRDLRDFGPDALRRSTPWDPVYRPDGNPDDAAPATLDVLTSVMRLGGRRVRSQLGRSRWFEQWFVAYRFDERDNTQTLLDPDAGAFTPIVPPRDRFWADPFPVCTAGRYFVFVEEYLYATRRGRISVIELERNGAWRAPSPVLERPFHLSYPFVFEWRGEFFMCPEAAQDGSIQLYRARSFPGDWQLEAMLVDGVRAVDPTIVQVGDKWWLFANMAAADTPDPSYLDDELHLFHAPTPLGPWTPHRRNPVKTDARSARPAGRLFEAHGQLIRPAQDCSARYGYAITYNRVERIDRDAYHEVPVSRTLPRWAPRLVCTHTINRAADLVLIDGKARRRRWS